MINIHEIFFIGISTSVLTVVFALDSFTFNCCNACPRYFIVRKKFIIPCSGYIYWVYAICFSTLTVVFFDDIFVGFFFAKSCRCAWKHLYLCLIFIFWVNFMPSNVQLLETCSLLSIKSLIGKVWPVLYNQVNRSKFIF